ncbi:hypothetical protein Tco_0783701, partial [Tanacetum coccineum]
AMTLLDKRAAIEEPRITNTFYSYQARRASGDRHHQVNNHFFTAINANKEVSTIYAVLDKETSRVAESGPLLLKTNNTTISTKTVVSPRADKSIASLDEIMAALKSGQCAIVDIMTRIPLFSKSVQALPMTCRAGSDLAQGSLVLRGIQKMKQCRRIKVEHVRYTYISSIRLIKNESKKLRERATLAENETTKGYGDRPYIPLLENSEKKPLMDRVDSALKEITTAMKQLDRSTEAIKAINSFFHLRSHEPQESLTNIMLQFYKVWTNRESDIIASIKIAVMGGCMGWNPARIMLQVFRCFLVERGM